MSSDRTRERLSLSIEHLQNAIAYANRGRDAFFDPENPDTLRLVEGEIRKAYESLNRQGDRFYNENSAIDRARIGEIRQQLTHDYADVDPDLLWRLATVEAPLLLRRLARAKVPT